MSAQQRTQRNTNRETGDKKTLVLLDAHAILHRAYHALPEFTGPNGEPTGALYGVVAMLLRIVEELKPDYIAACFDLPEPTYRHDVFEGYKATREKADDVLVEQIDRSRDIFAAFGIRIFEHPGFEADDILGTIASQTREMPELTVIIASGDMDTLQLVEKKRVQVYTLKKGIKDTVLYDETAVRERFGFAPQALPDFKGLCGDPSDNIPGIAGIGTKTATELITHFGSLEKIYAALEKENADALFKDAGITPRIVGLLRKHEEDAAFSKMLATIRLDAPVTFTLPDHPWREKLDREHILTLFSELGFRTLAARVEQRFGADAHGTTREEEVVSERERAETSVALWLLESDTTNPTHEDILAYARGRGYTNPTFSEARELIFTELKDAGLLHLYTDIEEPLIDILKQMQETGIRLDVEYLATLSKKMHAELSSLEERIHTLAGSEFNINSPKQMADVLYDGLGLGKSHKKTATGQRSTRESELEKLVDEHPIIPEILRYREVQKLVSTYIDNLPDMVGEDGRLHPTFLQAGTVTGRMATTHPSIQNIPVRTEEGRAIRRAFVAAEGYELVSIDYSQIELRIAAILSGDPNLIDIFTRGEDVHRGVALRVFGVNADEVTPDMRRRAKVINFGILYGMGVNALRTNLGDGTTREEAQEFLNAYFNTFTRLAEYLEETKEYARTHGYTETFFGRRRYFPGITSHAPFIRASAERMAINAPIQGTAADVMRIAMVRVDEYITQQQVEADLRMLVQVHDELIFEIKSARVTEFVPALTSTMTDIFSEEESRGVPISADAKRGANWEEMESVEA